MKNSADLGGFYLHRPSASVDNILYDLQNSSYHTQPHPIIAKSLKSLLLPFFPNCTRNHLITYTVRLNGYHLCCWHNSENQQKRAPSTEVEMSSEQE